MASTAATPMVIGPRAGGVAVCQVGEGTGDKDEGRRRHQVVFDHIDRYGEVSARRLFTGHLVARVA
ncbi:hypothetical protein [Streptomyces umbrinus]|uniref:hypothetical protein n=1 Tax=Streptomyces umbrinus TaxID=67370 RepID=UPI0033DDF09E